MKARKLEQFGFIGQSNKNLPKAQAASVVKEVVRLVPKQLPEFSERYYQLTYEERTAVDTALMEYANETFMLTASLDKSLQRAKDLAKGIEALNEQYSIEVQELLRAYANTWDAPKKDDDLPKFIKKYATKTMQNISANVHRMTRELILVNEQIQTTYERFSDAMMIIGYANTIVLSEHAADVTVKDKTGLAKTADDRYIVENFPMSVAAKLAYVINSKPEMRDFSLEETRKQATRNAAVLKM